MTDHDVERQRWREHGERRARIRLVIVGKVRQAQMLLEAEADQEQPASSYTQEPQRRPA